MGIETKFTFKSKAASLLVGVSMVAMTSGASALETLPPDKSMSGIEVELVGRDDLYSYKSCDSYNEAPLTAAYVEAGKLPPVAERLPKTPMMMSKLKWLMELVIMAEHFVMLLEEDLKVGTGWLDNIKVGVALACS